MRGPSPVWLKATDVQETLERRQCQGPGRSRGRGNARRHDGRAGHVKPLKDIWHVHVNPGPRNCVGPQFGSAWGGLRHVLNGMRQSVSQILDGLGVLKQAAPQKFFAAIFEMVF